MFDLYDFNELNSLSFIDLEFMFISVCNSTYKIFLLNASANEEEISKFLNSHFSEDARINISQMLKYFYFFLYFDLLRWSTKIDEIREFFSIIQKDFPPLKKNSKNKLAARTIYEKV